MRVIRSHSSFLRLGAPAARRGSLLVVIMGLILILLGMTVAVSVRVNAGLDGAERIQRHAQSFLMMNACKLYLDIRWMQLKSQPGFSSSSLFSAPMKMLGPLETDAASPGPDRYALTGGDGGDVWTANLASSMNRSATESATTGLGPLSNRLGWFHASRKSDTEAYVVAAGGGGGISQGGLQTKRSIDRMFETAGQWSVREANDVVYYYLLTNLGGASATSATVQVFPLQGRSADGKTPKVNGENIWLMN